MIVTKLFDTFSCSHFASRTGWLVGYTDLSMILLTGWLVVLCWSMINCTFVVLSGTNDWHKHWWSYLTVGRQSEYFSIRICMLSKVRMLCSTAKTGTFWISLSRDWRLDFSMRREGDIWNIFIPSPRLDAVEVAITFSITLDRWFYEVSDWLVLVGNN